MSKKRTPGMSEQDGKTKKSILLFLMNCTAYSSSTSDIREHLLLTSNIRETKGIIKHIHDLRSFGIIQEDPLNQPGKEYRYLVSDISNVLEYFSKSSSLHEVMETSFFKAHITNIIDLFPIEQPSSSTINPDKKALQIGLKYSPTLLDAIVKRNITSDTINQFMDSKAMSTIAILSYGSRLCMTSFRKVSEKIGGYRDPYRDLAGRVSKNMDTSYVDVENYVRSHPLPFIITNYIETDCVGKIITASVIASNDFKNDMRELAYLTYEGIIKREGVDTAFNSLGMS